MMVDTTVEKTVEVVKEETEAVVGETSVDVAIVLGEVPGTVGTLAVTERFPIFEEVEIMVELAAVETVSAVEMVSAVEEV